LTFFFANSGFLTKKTSQPKKIPTTEKKINPMVSVEQILIVASASPEDFKTHAVHKEAVLYILEDEASFQTLLRENRVDRKPVVSVIPLNAQDLFPPIAKTVLQEGFSNESCLVMLAVKNSTRIHHVAAMMFDTRLAKK
jgi:hypothetical protein